MKASRAKQNNAITCSKECLSALRRRNRIKHCGSEEARRATCAFCSREFERKPSQLAKYGKNYCSKECAAAGKSGPNPKLRTGQEIPCQTCGTPTWRTAATLRPNTYCSRACAARAPRRPTRVPRVVKLCACCGKVMTLLPFQAVRYRFCSLSCAARTVQGAKRGTAGRAWTVESRRALSTALIRKYENEWAEKPAAQAAMMRGARNPAWNGGRATKPYAPGFTRRLKQRIAARDGHRCRICGMRRGRGTHAVHHIDGSKTNHSEENLVLLCRSCHSLLHHGRVSLP